jgi:hypothetical protein
MKDDISESSVSYGDVTPEHVSSTAQDPTLIGGLAPGVKGTKGIIPIEGSSQGESPSPTLPPLRCLATEDRSPSPDPIPSSGLEKSNTPEIKPAASENVYIKNERN